MKKLILPIILILTVALFLPSKADAQTRQECEKIRDRASYNCLLGFSKCYSPCVANTKDNMGCRNSCKQAENACDKQVDADYKTCLGAIKKDSENPSETNSSSEVQTNTECYEAFNKESNSCLKESTKCLNSCADKAYAAMSLTVDGGKVNLECQRSVCDPALEACNNKAKANFKACLDSGQQPAAAEAKKELATSNGFIDINFLETWSEFIRDPASIVKETEILTEKADAAERPRINTSQLSIFRQPTEGVAWIDQSKMSDLWIKAKGQNEYQQVKNGLQTIEPGSYVKASEPTSIMVRGVGRVDLRPGPSGSALLAIEERNGAISPLLLLGEMEIAYQKPIDANTQKPVDWEQIKFVVRTPNSSVTVSRTHYLVKYDDKENKTTVAVYEGQVEVKPAGGKALSITPDGDKPGIAIVSQKLSPVKLVLTGLALAAVAGGIVWFVKRKKKK